MRMFIITVEGIDKIIIDINYVYISSIILYTFCTTYVFNNFQFTT